MGTGQSIPPALPVIPALDSVIAWAFKQIHAERLIDFGQTQGGPRIQPSISDRSYQSSGAALMNRSMLMLAVVAVIVTVGACTKRDFNAVTGTTDFTSVALSSEPTSYNLHVEFVPAVITTDTATGLPDTVPAHYAPLDSAEFSVTATLEPQGVVVANGITNTTITPDNANVASLNSDGGFVIGTGPGTTNLTFVYTDVDHNFTTTTLAVPVTVTLSAP
jgi:hypothetical protein